MEFEPRHNQRLLRPRFWSSIPLTCLSKRFCLLGNIPEESDRSPCVCVQDRIHYHHNKCLLVPLCGRKCSCDAQTFGDGTLSRRFFTLRTFGRELSARSSRATDRREGNKRPSCGRRCSPLPSLDGFVGSHLSGASCQALHHFVTKTPFLRHTRVKTCQSDRWHEKRKAPSSRARKNASSHQTEGVRHGSTAPRRGFKRDQL